MQLSTDLLPQAALWDMDGTLIESEPYWMLAETELVESFGGTWTQEDGLRLVGLGLLDSAHELQRAGVDLQAGQIIESLTDRVIELVQTRGVPFRPGSRELLDEFFRAGIPNVIVTMSMSRLAAEIVSAIGSEKIQFAVAGDDVNRPKPYPDPYLLACEKLGVRPADAVAFEDSPNGAKSALAAGTVTIGVPLTVDLNELPVHAVVPDPRTLNLEEVSKIYQAARLSTAH